MREDGRWNAVFPTPRFALRRVGTCALTALFGSELSTYAPEYTTLKIHTRGLRRVWVVVLTAF